MNTRVSKLVLRLAAALIVLVAGSSAPAHEGHHHGAKPGVGKVVRSKASGPWSAAATWEEGKLPQAGEKVLIKTGHIVTYDVRSEAVLRSVHISGTLKFATDKDTLLQAGLIKIQPGDTTEEDGFDCDVQIDPRHHDHAKQAMAALLVGTPNQPIPAGKTAKIRLHYIEGMDKQSCPALVCCGGRMDLHGAPLNRTWVKLGATVEKGATEVSLAEPVTGWNVGDQIVVTSTESTYDKEGLSETRTIKAIEGDKLKFEEPLAYGHLGEGEYRGEVANLSRNVVVESATPDGNRGHTMYHRHSAGSLSYTEFRHLGKKDVLGRYSLHFHLVGQTMRGSYVQGVSVWDSHNRWLTVHGTNYLVVRDCVGFGSIGHGFFLEDGTEVYNVFDRNLAIGARAGKRLPQQVLPFDQNEGAGFWWANSLNTFTRNVAADNDRYGFRYEATPSRNVRLDLPIQQPDGKEQMTDIRTLPFVRFEDNEVHSNSGLYGINLGEGVRGVGPDARHPFVMRNTKIWNVHYGFRPQVPSLLVENMTIKSHYGVYHPNFDNHVYRDVTIRQTSTEPFNRGHDDDSLQHGQVTVDGLTFDNCKSGQMPLIQISDNNDTGKAVSHFRNVSTANWTDNSRLKAIVNMGGGPRREPKTKDGVPIYLHDWFGPGRHAMVVSTRSPEYKADPERFHAEPPLTGNESRVAEVSDVPFPQLLDPIDDLPPTTVITHVSEVSPGKLLVKGTTSDNGVVKQVLVSDVPAKATAANFSQWEATVDALPAGVLFGYAVDEAGNREGLPHQVAVAR